MRPGSSTRFLGPRVATLGFLVLTGAFGLNFAAGQFFVPLSDAQGWDVGVLSVAAAINTAVSGVVQLPVGRLIDRCGPRAVIGGSLALLGGSYVLMAFAEQTWHVVLAYGVLGGVGFAGSSSLAVTVLVSHWYQRRRAAVLPRVFLGINLGQLTLVPLGGLLIEHVGHRSAYAALGLIVAAGSVPLMALVVDAPARVGQHPDGADAPPPGARRTATFAAAIRSRSFWLGAFAFGANGWTLYFMLLHLPRLAVDAGAGVASGGRLVAVAAATGALTMLALAPVVRRHGPRRAAVVLLALRALVLAATAALVTEPVHLFIAAAAFGISGFPVIPLMMSIISQRFGTNVLGAALGLVFVSHQLFASLGVLSGGLLRAGSGSYDAALLAGVAVLLAGIGLLLALDDGEAGVRTDLVLRDRPRPTPILEGGTQ